MLSKSAAFFLGTVGFSVIFLGTHLDTIHASPAQTREHNITPQVVQGKQLWEKNNCICHPYWAKERITRRNSPKSMSDVGRSLSKPCCAIPGHVAAAWCNTTSPTARSRPCLSASGLARWISMAFPQAHLATVAVPVASRDNVVARREQPKVLTNCASPAIAWGAGWRGRASPG